MTQSLIISFCAVFPLFLIISLGCILKKARVIEDAAIPSINKLLFNVLFPCLIFCCTYGAKFKGTNNAELAAFIAGIALFFWIGTIPFAKKISRESKTQGAIVTGICRTNFVVISLPVLANLFGDDISSYIAFPTFALLIINNIVSVVILELFRQGDTDIKVLIRNLIKSPLIISTLLGIICSILNLSIPEVIHSTIKLIGDTAVPLALLLIGASMQYSTLSANKKLLFICNFGKLILLPGIGGLVGYLMGFTGADMVIVVTFLAAPIPSTSYTMAMELDSDVVLTRDCVFLSTSLCMITFFLWIFLLKALQVF